MPVHISWSRFVGTGTSFAMALCAIVLTGEVVPGVECPAIRTDDGKVVALSHIPIPYETGDRVTVRGPRYVASGPCQQEVLLVESAEKAG